MESQKEQALQDVYKRQEEGPAVLHDRIDADKGQQNDPAPFIELIFFFLFHRECDLSEWRLEIFCFEKRGRAGGNLAPAEACPIKYGGNR